jgi:hypothetical protein
VPSHVTFSDARIRQQRQLLLEQLVVVLEVLAEERERLDERAAAGHDLGAAAGQQVDRGELLEHAHGVVAREHRHAAREADALGALGDSRERHGGRRDGEVGSVVLADGEHVQPDLVGQLRLLDEVAHALGRVRAAAQVRERADADLHG